MNLKAFGRKVRTARKMKDMTGEAMAENVILRRHFCAKLKREQKV